MSWSRIDADGGPVTHLLLWGKHRHAQAKPASLAANCHIDRPDDRLEAEMPVLFRRFRESADRYKYELEAADLRGTPVSGRASDPPGNHPHGINQTRLIVVAVVVCGFAVGMAGLLNYFKYRAAADRILTDRWWSPGAWSRTASSPRSRSACQFAEIGTLPGMLDREARNRRPDPRIDIFDIDGKMLYKHRPAARHAPGAAAWIAAARRQAAPTGGPKSKASTAVISVDSGDIGDMLHDLADHEGR